MLYAALGCRCVIVLIFATSGLSKVYRRSAFADFVRMLRAVRIVPASLTRPAAIAVIAVELAIAGTLLIGSNMLIGFVASALLLILFTGMIAVLIRRRASVACRCFGAGRVPLGYPHLLRNALILAAAAVGIWAQRQGSDIAGEPAGIAVALAAGSVSAVLLIRFDDLVDLFSPTTTA